MDPMIIKVGFPGVPGPAGDDAYEIAVAQGFVGTREDWLASLRGVDGENGKDGKDGDDAYAVAVSEGFIGTRAEWLASLKGVPGPAGDDAYEVAVAGGFIGTRAEWLASLKGDPGLNGDPGPGAVSFATDAEALAYSTANPGVTVFSRQV